MAPGSTDYKSGCGESAVMLLLVLALLVLAPSAVATKRMSR